MIDHPNSSWSGDVQRRVAVSRRQLTITACHGGSEHREQEEQGRFRPEVAADATDGVGRWSKSGIPFQCIAPANIATVGAIESRPTTRKVAIFAQKNTLTT